MITREDIIERFGKFDLRKSPLHFHIPETYSRASVLIPLFYRSGEWHVLLTVRSKKLQTHSGGVAFPCGRFDDGDEDEIFTALRESEEEIGLPFNDVEVVALLPKSFVRPNIIVDIVVGIIPKDFVPKPNPEEVELVFSLPLSRCLQDDVRIVKGEFNGHTYKMFFIDEFLNGRKITTWGFTALHCIWTALVVLDSDKELIDYSGLVHTKHNVYLPENGFAIRFLEQAKL